MLNLKMTFIPSIKHKSTSSTLKLYQIQVQNPNEKYVLVLETQQHRLRMRNEICRSQGHPLITLIPLPVTGRPEIRYFWLHLLTSSEQNRANPVLIRKWKSSPPSAEPSGTAWFLSTIRMNTLNTNRTVSRRWSGRLWEIIIWQNYLFGLSVQVTRFHANRRT